MNNKEILWGLMIVFGIIAVVVAISLIAFELYGAKKFCREQEGSYSINFGFKDFHHLCDDEVIVQYDYGWGYPIEPFNNSNLYLNVGNPFSN